MAPGSSNAVTVTVACLALSVVFLALSGSPFAAHAHVSNILLSGETLGAGGRLAHGNHSFVVGGDCNLVLDDGVWQSATSCGGSGCRLTLGDDGRLTLRPQDGAAVWTSPARSTPGKYVAVLQPSGKVTVYGPAVWSADELGDHQIRRRLGCLKGGSKWDNCIIVREDDLDGSPLPRHKLNCLYGGRWDNCIVGGPSTAGIVLFSGEILLDGGSLTARGGRFRPRGGYGRVRCILRLDHRGGLAFVEDDRRVLWKNNVQSAQGEYVAILRQDGRVAVYGPAVWSTAGGPSDHQEALRNVKMVTEGE